MDKMKIEDLYDDALEVEGITNLNEDELIGKPTGNEVEEDEKDNDKTVEDVIDDTPFDAMKEYLNQFNIQDKKIKYEEDGEIKEVNFDDLDPKEQFEILNELSASRGIEDHLTGDELDLIEFLREKELTIQELIEQRALELVTSVDKSDIASLDNDEIYTLYLKDTIKDITEEELEEELQAAKTSESVYNKKVNAIRANLIEAEQRSLEMQRHEETQAQQQELEQAKNNIISTAVSTQHIAGYELDDEMRNELLSQLVEFDEHGQNKFVNTLSNPKMLLKAAWYINYGDDLIDSLQEYYKQEVIKAEEKGKKSILEGMSASPVETSGNVNNKSQGRKNSKGKKIIGMDELWSGQ